MFTEGPPYSTTILRRPPTQAQFFHIDVANEWDFVAEAFVGSSTHSSTQLNQLTLLLESHGIVIHKLPAPQFDTSAVTQDIRSPFVVTTPGDQEVQTPTGIGNPFFPRDVALVHDNRVIEAPPPRDAEHSDGGIRSQNVVALFNRLESAGVQVTRWQSTLDKLPTDKLVDVEGSQLGGDRDEEGPRFCPSDILILCPTLLVTRLSSHTNNKGLEYLWSALSRPNTISQGDDRDTGIGIRRANSSRLAHITTLLVRVTDPDASVPSSHVPASIPSPRSPRFGTSIYKMPLKGYIPLCRALVPLRRNLMLYDPALIPEDEARRLKTVLDRVQDVPDSGTGNVSGSGAVFTEGRAKRDSAMSYGTFGSLDRLDDDGWQLISVDGLHSVSILLVSPQLAVLSRAPSDSQLNYSLDNPTQKALANVSQILESLGVRPVRLPRTDFNERQSDWCVRDAILVLRRESNLEATDDENEQTNRDAQQQDEEENGGCMSAVCASLSACLFESWTSSGASETASEYL